MIRELKTIRKSSGSPKLAQPKKASKAKITITEEMRRVLDEKYSIKEVDVEMLNKMLNTPIGCFTDQQKKLAGSFRTRFV